jgi:hypothetical protein
MNKEENRSKLRKYQDLLKEVAGKIAEFKRATAKEYVPKMYLALRGNPDISSRDARIKIEKDCESIWSKRTILDALPDEAKDQEKQNAGRLRQKGANSAAFPAAQPTKRRIAINISGKTYTENVESPSPLTESYDNSHDTVDESNPDSIDFEFALIFRDVRHYMAPLYTKIGEAGLVWFSGEINRNNGSVIRAQIGRKKGKGDDIMSVGTIDRSISSSHYDDSFDDDEILI